MSGNFKKLIAVGYCLLVSLIIALVSGVVMAALGDPVEECVKTGGAAFIASAVLGVAIVALFSMPDDRGPNPPDAGGRAGRRV